MSMKLTKKRVRPSRTRAIEINPATSYLTRNDFALTHETELCKELLLPILSVLLRA